MSWTINEKSQTSETQYFNGSYSGNLSADSGDPEVISSYINVSGYTAGTISFRITTGTQPPNWTASLEMNIKGNIDILDFPVSTSTLNILSGDTNSTFYIEWSIPLQKIALGLNNNTGFPITIDDIRIMTETNGGGVAGTTTSGASTGPGGNTPEIQFNDGGAFKGASGALYDKTANTNNGQIQLADGTVDEPMLAFSDNTHPAGNYDTGIYRISPDNIGFSITGNQGVGIYSTAIGNFIQGLNVGTTTGRVGGIRRLSDNVDDSWEDGHLGNSAELIFTPADFKTTGGNRPFSGVNSSQEDPGGRSSRFYGTITLHPSTILVAQKIIPKGFRIFATGGSPDTITIHTPAAPITRTTCYVSAQSYNIGTGVLTNLLSANGIFDTNTPTDLSGVTVVGDGKTMVTIMWDPSLALTSITGPSGASITMRRV